MAETSLPHQIAFCELEHGKRPQCGPKKRWIDAVKNDLTSLKIDLNTWRDAASDRASWREKIHETTKRRHEDIQQQQIEKRAKRYEIEQDFTWTCPICRFERSGPRGRQYVQSHITQAHKEALPPSTEKSLKCMKCDFEANTGSGLSSHMRWKHPDFVSATAGLKPVRSIRPCRSPTPGTSGSSSQPPQSPNPLQCVCGRSFKTKAGLGSHKRGQQCTIMSRN
uniref:C2H2-type domain-containing protein n=1 Tax=Cacopsylla melanoneura TaxID=428564 RepID=A0A8D8VYA2_9HEMI